MKEFWSELNWWTFLVNLSTKKKSFLIVLFINLYFFFFFFKSMTLHVELLLPLPLFKAHLYVSVRELNPFETNKNKINKQKIVKLVSRKVTQCCGRI